MDRAIPVEPRAEQRGDGVEQDLAHCRVFVAQVEVDGLGIDCPRGDQHAFEHVVRVVLEVVTVLERAGFALVGVDRHHARRARGPAARRPRRGPARGAAHPLNERFPV